MSNKYLSESDYSADSLRWIKLREESSFKPNPYSKRYNIEDLEKLQNDIIKTNDSALAYFFVIEFVHNPHMMQKVIIDNKNAKYAFLFAQNIKNCDIKALQKIVVDSKNKKYICKFACHVEGAECKSLESIILKSKNVKYAHDFLKHVKTADFRKFKKIILASKKPKYLFELAKILKSTRELRKIENLIIETGSFTYMRLFAEKIKSANIEKIEQIILDSDNVNEIKKFAKYVKRSRMKRFFLVL